MVEVSTKSRVGAAVDAVESGARAAGERAVQVSQERAEAYAKAVREAERKLADRGLSAAQVQELIARTTHDAGEDVTKALHELGTRGRKLRKELAKSTKATRKELAQNTKRARKALAARIEPDAPSGGRKWWLILVFVVVAIGVVAAIRALRTPADETGYGPDESDSTAPDTPET